MLSAFIPKDPPQPPDPIGQSFLVSGPALRLVFGGRPQTMEMMESLLRLTGSAPDLQVRAWSSETVDFRGDKGTGR